MQKGDILKSVLRLVFLCLPLCAFASEIRKIDFAEYSNKIDALSSACASKGAPSFSGFCLSREFGKPAFDDPVQTSISVGLEIASFEHFYGGCEHSDFASANDALGKARRVLDAAKFLEEIKVQKDALENYVGRFYFCKTKRENDATISGRIKWFEYMGGRYSAAPARANASTRDGAAGNKSITYAAGIGKERFSLTCDGAVLINTACLIRVGSSAGAQPLRFMAQPTQYGDLLRRGVEKALTPEQRLHRPGTSDVAVLSGLALDRCHPAAESNGVSGDLLQLCIPSDSSKVVLFMRGLCDRCEFEPVVLEKQASP